MGAIEGGAQSRREGGKAGRREFKVGGTEGGKAEGGKVEGGKAEGGKAEGGEAEGGKVKAQNFLKARWQGAQNLRRAGRIYSKRPMYSCGTGHALAPCMNAWREQMKARTHSFSVAVILLLQTIPDRSDTRRVKDQLAGAAAGLDLNWRAACRARSHKEFTAKLGVVVEEADEAEACLDTMCDARIVTGDEARRLQMESKELRSIFAKASATASRNERTRRAID